MRTCSIKECCNDFYAKEYCKKHYSRLRKRGGVSKDFLRHKPKGFWNKEEVLKEALKYSTKKEFSIKCCSAYRKAIKLGIENEAFSHMKHLGNISKRCLYTIINTDVNQIYIGITGNYERRMGEHHKKDLFSKGFHHYKLTEYLPNEKAVSLEMKWIKHYNEHRNFICLNKTKGGEL